MAAERVAFRSGAPKRDERCWQWGRDACRNHATNTVRIGSLVYHYCDNPKHDPNSYR